MIRQLVDIVGAVILGALFVGFCWLCVAGSGYNWQ